MKLTARVFWAALVVALPVPWAAAEPAKPIIADDVVFEEVDGMVAVEAEHFFQQEKTDVRGWYLITADQTPDVSPDGDPPHVAGASGNAYLEVLPDTRRTHGDKLIGGQNFVNEPGLMAVLSYRIHFQNAGRYYVWARTYSTGTEDNGLHVGLDGSWPESGQRMQWTAKKNWFWDSKQRTQTVHTGVPGQLFLDIAEPGVHVITFSMREDGFEFDKWLMTKDRDFKRPDDSGPAPRLKTGTLPKPFRQVAAAPAEPTSRFPAHWGDPPAIETRDIRPLPGGYGQGSSTLANWIQAKLDEDQKRAGAGLTLNASDTALGNSGYYLDRGKWAAINPEQRKQAKVMTAFPYPSGRYDVTLKTVGESDGRSKYSVRIADVEIGTFESPLSAKTYEEGPQFNTTWKNVSIGEGDVIEIASQTGSLDGEESSRARWSQLAFSPTDETTRAAVAKLKNAGTVKTPNKPQGPPLVLPRGEDGDGTITISGELKQWHKVTLSLDGPYAHEMDNKPNPFTDRLFMVRFFHSSGSPSYNVPGYFAADGDAANSGAQSGTVWRAHLSPDKAGTWNYTISFLASDGVGITDASADTKLAPYDGREGTFVVAATDKNSPDFRAEGRLQYVGEHYLRFAGSGRYFQKAGPDAPETLLAYVDFDGTEARKKTPLKTWKAHQADWRPGDPTWQDGKGKGLIGAVNYLASKGVNAMSFLPYNAGGDGDNVWPFVERDDKLHYDCSKLDQWGIVFDHATAKGLYLHFKLQENEIDDNRRGHAAELGTVPESLDGGKLGPERKLYCRELIARFAHELALNWNIGEENTQSSDEIRAMVKYLHDTDPYTHHIVIHTFPNQQEKVYRPLLGDKSLLTGVSLQNHWSAVHRLTLQWLTESSAAGRNWVVANDEQNAASLGVPPDPGYEDFSGFAKDKNRRYSLHDIRKATLWGNLLAGGAGVEYYFGYQLPQNDLQCEDFRSRDQSWDYCRIAIEFFRQQKIPFWKMACADQLVGNADHDNSCYCFALPGKLYLVYLPEGGNQQLDLQAAKGNFTVAWFNPREGGALKTGSVRKVTGGASVALGPPPAAPAEDWLVVVRSQAK